MIPENNRKATKHPEKYAAFIGLDWSHGEHVFSLLCNTPEALPECARLTNDPASIRSWLERLRTRFGGNPVALCLEDNRGLLLRELCCCEWMDVYAVNPATAAGYRRMFTPSGDKSDERDSGSLLDLLVRHPEKVRRLSRANPSFRPLEQLCRLRRKAVDRRTSQIEALMALLRTHYPLALKMVGEHLGDPLALHFLRRWNCTRELLKSRPETLRSFFHKHRCRSEKRIAERLEALAAAPVDSEPDELESVAIMETTEHLDLISALNKVIASYDRAIREHVCKCLHQEPRAAFIKALPGAGPALAPRLMAAFLLQQPQSAADMQMASGIAPIRLQSGNRLYTLMRRHCSKFLRQSFHEYAGCSIRYSRWAKAFYTHATEVRKMSSQSAKRALAFKWIRVLTACWKSGQAYDEERYLRSLQKKNVDYLTCLAPISNQTK